MSPISVEQYLADEAISSFRREYVDGYVYVRPSTRNLHNLIATNLLGALGQQLRGKPCAAYNSDTKLRIRTASHTRFYYPDAMVVCISNPPEDPYQDQPALIAEVLSSETRRTDEGEKREAYLTIPSLEAYLLIEADTPVVHVYRRGNSGFVLETHEVLEAAIEFSKIGASLALADLFERVRFPA